MSDLNLAEVGTDCISRRRAIDAVTDELDRIDHVPQWVFDRLEGRLKQLPPAQPEIIRCKDCKHWDGVDTCDVIDAPVWDNDFCSMAERRSDE